MVSRFSHIKFITVSVVTIERNIESFFIYSEKLSLVCRDEEVLTHVFLLSPIKFDPANRIHISENFPPYYCNVHDDFISLLFLLFILNTYRFIGSCKNSTERPLVSSFSAPDGSINVKIAQYQN